MPNRRSLGVISPAASLLEEARQLKHAAIIAAGMGRYSQAEALEARAANKTALAKGREVKEL